MARNFKPEYINKLRKINQNGYTFDISNYLYNPAFGNEYPAFMKKVSETENTETYRRIYYFKYYDGNGEYKAETFTREKNGGEWQVVKNRTEETLEESRRYNLNTILKYCAA